MKLVFICSPYQGDIEMNVIKARRFCYFAFKKNVTPFAPHLHFTQFLDENINEEREAGITMGMEFLDHCDEIWIFGRLLSEGMDRELKKALQLKKKVRYFNDQCQELEESK